MDLRTYCHNTLIEENPFVLCRDVSQRFVVYEEVADRIAFELLDCFESGDRPDVETIVRSCLTSEYGDDLDHGKVNRVVVRLKASVLAQTGETKEGFND